MHGFDFAREVGTVRTPLAAIAGASTGLLESPGQDEKTRNELLQSIAEESHRLSRLVDNLLDMTRLESGAVKLNLQWHVLEELVGSALGRLRRELQRHTVRTEIAHDLPLIHVDGLLLEQVLVNLLDNAVRYTPRRRGSPRRGQRARLAAGSRG
jgi:two-component system sensor histidine kinase KdpD